MEIASAIADKLGLELQIDDMEFDSALLAVQNNTADVMLAGLSYSEERDEVVDFTDSYATGVQVVIVKDGSDVTMDNLGEKMIGTQRGTTGYIYASDTRTTSPPMTTAPPPYRLWSTARWTLSSSTRLPPRSLWLPTRA